MNKCEICGSVVSSNVSICPNCGDFIRNGSKNNGNGLAVLSFFIPVLGFILYFVLKNKDSHKAKVLLIGSISGIVVFFVINIVMYLFVIVRF